MEGKLEDVEQREIIFKELYDQILNKETGYGCFKVFDYEAALGKTYHYCKAIVKNYCSYTDFWGEPSPFMNFNKSLIVIKTIKEGNIIARTLNDFAESDKSIFRNFDKFAIAINSEYKEEHPMVKKMSDQEYIKHLKSFPVIIITQVEYYKICQDLKRGQEQYGDRNTLIIDEEIDMVSPSFKSLSIGNIADIEDKYFRESTTCKNIFQRIVQKTKEYFSMESPQLKRMFISSDNLNINSLIQRLYYEMNFAIDDQYIRNLRRYPEICKGNDTPELVRLNLKNRIDEIEKFYDNENVILYQYTLYRYNPNVQLFTLKNNLWIDASASFNHMYKLNASIFDTSIKSTPYIDYANCNLHFDMVTKSTTSGKERYVDMERDALKYVLYQAKKRDKILVIDNDKFCNHIRELINNSKDYELLKELLSEKCFDLTNYQAMRGSNNWKTYNKVFLLQQPQINLPYYVFLYEYWSKKKLSDIEMYLGNFSEKEGKVFGFHLPEKVNNLKQEYSEEQLKNNKSLELLRYTSQVSSMYQGLKRIQRKINPKGDFYIVLNDYRMRELLKNQLKNIHLFYVNMNPEHKKDYKIDCVDIFQNQVYHFEENSIIDVKRLAYELNTTKDYIFTMLKRNPAIQVIVKAKKIEFFDLQPISWFILANDLSKGIPIDDLESEYKIKWDNYRRSVDIKKINKIKKLKIKNRLLYAIA